MMKISTIVIQMMQSKADMFNSQMLNQEKQSNEAIAIITDFSTDIHGLMVNQLE